MAHSIRKDFDPLQLPQYVYILWPLTVLELTNVVSSLPVISSQPLTHPCNVTVAIYHCIIAPLDFPLCGAALTHV